MYSLLCLFFQLYLILCGIPAQAIAGGKTVSIELPTNYDIIERS